MEFVPDCYNARLPSMMPSHSPRVPVLLGRDCTDVRVRTKKTQDVEYRIHFRPGCECYDINTYLLYFFQVQSPRGRKTGRVERGPRAWVHKVEFFRLLWDDMDLY